MAECGQSESHLLGDPGPGATNQRDTTGRKKRKTKEDKETGVGQAAQRGETQELPIEGTQNNQKQNPSGLDMETLWYRKEFHLCLYWGQPSQEQPLGCTSTHPKLGQRGESDPQEKVGTEDAHDEEETVGGEVGAVDAPCGRSAEMRGLWWAGLFRPVYTAAALQVCRASEATGLAKVPALSQRVSSPE